VSSQCFARVLSEHWTYSVAFSIHHKSCKKIPRWSTTHHWFGLAPSRVRDKVDVRAERPALDEAADKIEQRNGRRLQNAKMVFHC
jgi:hypothetical protein